MPPDQKLHQTVIRCGCMLLHDNVRILWPNDNSACSHSHWSENELRQKRWFFGKNAHLQPSVVQPIGRTENASDGAASILALIELYTASSHRDLYSKFFSKKWKFWERWRVDVDGCSSTLWATAAMFSIDLIERAREWVALSNKDPVCRIRFTNWLITNCVEDISFLPNFPHKFLTVWVEDSPL